MALRANGGKSPGPDGVHPELLRRLPPAGLIALRALLNRSWREGRVPSAWKSAVIVPIPKKGKPKTSIGSYRPVSLLPCTAKILERLVLARLDHWQRLVGLVPPEQAGFQVGRSAVDSVAQVVQPAFDALQPRPASRTLLVAVDLRAAFDRVRRLGLLSQLSTAGIPGPWLRWLRSWLADRRARVRWNSSLSGCRVMSAGVPQGSPLSPLLFDIFVAGLPEALRTASPSVQVVQYADDLTLASRGTDPIAAAVPMQAALDRLSAWAREHAVEIAPEKTEAVVLTTDPSQVNAKCRPQLSLNGSQLSYKAAIKILGVTIDSQLRFTQHSKYAIAKLSARTNIIKALTGTKWGANEHTLRSLYVGYARPAALYAAGVWLPFLAPTHVSRLESANYAAARVITGAPAGSNSVATCREAGLLPLTLLAKREAADLLLHARRFPDGHVLKRLTHTAPAVPRRLRFPHGLRGNWFDTASATLSCLPSDVNVEPWPDNRLLPAPWSLECEGPITFVLAGADATRDDIPERRRLSALEALVELRTRSSRPAVEIWSDGAARGGTCSGGAGVFITWHDGRPSSTLSSPAGALSSSTAAEAVAALLGVSEVARQLSSTPSRLAIRLLFDSRALFCRLQRPPLRIDDLATRQTVQLLGAMARQHDVSVIWVPGHAGLLGNERADAAATHARDHGDQTGIYGQERALRLAVARALDTEALTAYRAALVGHIHLEASDGGRLADFSRLPRSQAVLLHRLRLNRWTGLRSTCHRWGLADSPDCQRCRMNQPDDCRHFILHCPALDAPRHRIFGASPTLSLLHHAPGLVLTFVSDSAAYAATV